MRMLPGYVLFFGHQHAWFPFLAEFLVYFSILPPRLDAVPLHKQVTVYMKCMGCHIVIGEALTELYRDSKMYGCLGSSLVLCALLPVVDLGTMVSEYMIAVNWTSHQFYVHDRKQFICMMHQNTDWGGD